MASALAPLLYLFVPGIMFLLSETIEAQPSVTLGSFLFADDENSWSSPSGEFAFGFRHLGDQDQFFLAIWFANIPDKTVVWFPDVSVPVPRGSKVELTSNGQLVIQAPGGAEIWSSTNNNSVKPLQGALLDTGNFRITSKDSSIIWESFKHPANTIVPTQVLELGDGLSSSGYLENKFLKGRFELKLSSNRLIMQQIDVDTGYSYGIYYTFVNASQLLLDDSGILYVNNSNGGGMQKLTSDGALPQRSTDYYHRVTLDFDGTITQYIHPKTSDGNETWSAVTVNPGNICESFINEDFYGSGACGYNSFCEILPYDNMPKCGCPPGFSLLDPSNQYGGCKQDGLNYLLECNQEGSNIENRLELLQMDGADWPFTDYEWLSPATESDCKISCMRDCFCAVAIFQDPKFDNGRGNCWKKKLPLSNGRLNRNSIDRRALFKVMKTLPNSGKDRKNPAIIILSVLLGTSAIFNFFSIAAISFTICYFVRRKLYDVCKVTQERDYETNLRFYSYKDLEKATNNFKEIVGRGAFGTVYKGSLPSSGSKNHIAVKMLEKVIDKGEKEFSSEVNVIGQTHHKNLVRLLGYCDEGNHRMLVYEFVENGALSNFLFGDLRLSWHQRVQIASGIARGLMYLHEECSKQIIHCDIKPQNILLDDFFTAKISDFGLAKLLISNHSQTLTEIRGTKGYVAPEWFKSMPVTVKVDVYSFGVMLLEVISRRKCVNFDLDEEAILTEWAYECYSKKEVEKLVEKDEEAGSDLKRLEKLVMVAMWCVHDEPSVRPSIRTVTLMLEGILEVPAPPCPFTYRYTSVSSSGLKSSTGEYLSAHPSMQKMKSSSNPDVKLISL